MGAESKEKARDSVKDEKSGSEKESDEKEVKGRSFVDYGEEHKESAEEKMKKIGWIDYTDSKSIDIDNENKIHHKTSEEKKEINWDSIDFSKDNSEEKKETKWDTIDFSKEHSSEEKETEGYKNDNMADNSMVSEKNHEKIEEVNLNEKEIIVKDNDLSRLKDVEENASDQGNQKKELEGKNDNFEEKGKDYETNIGREGTETLLFPSEIPEEQLEQTKDFEPENSSEQILDRKPEEIDEFELVTPEGKPEKPAEPQEIIELMEKGSYNSDYTSKQDYEQSSEIETKREQEDHLEQEFLNESDDRSKEELVNDLELINPETGESIPPQPDWEYIPLQDYLEQLHEQQENREEVQEIESEKERERIADQESELISKQDSEVISNKESENLNDQKLELVPEQESEDILKHNQGETHKKEHMTKKEDDSFIDQKKFGEYKQDDFKHIMKTKYEPIFSQMKLRKAQNISEKSDKEIKISQKRKIKRINEEIKEIDLNVSPTLVKKIEKNDKAKADYSSKRYQKISTKISENDKYIKSSEKLEKQKQEKLEERYHQETGKRPIYNKKQTKGFKEWLENQKEHNLRITDSNREGENREEWERLLEKWINNTNESEISQEIKEELLNIIRKYHQCRAIYWRFLQLSEKKELIRKELEEIEILIKKLEEMNNIEIEIFKNLRAFRNFYNQNIRWYKHHVKTEKHKFLRHLSQKLNYLKETKNPQKDINQNWKELLKDNLYKNKMLNLPEKSLIIKILQKEKLSQHDKKELISLLSKLSTEDLIFLLGSEFKQLTKNYIKWGWDYDHGVKREMLKKYLIINKYKKPEEKIKIRANGFKLILEKLKKYSYKEISDKIDHDFKVLINKRHKISTSVYNKLKKIMNVRNIPHDIYIGNKKKIKMEINDDIAEIIGVMLGDGNLGSDGSKVAIALNRIDEEKYVLYIKKKLKTIFYDSQPFKSRNWFKSQYNSSSKVVEIVCYSKNLHYFLVEKGLIPGNKVQNQISVPKEIFLKEIFKLKCLKGLFDTDGTINVSMPNRMLRIVFSNASKPLVESFKKICDDLGIFTGKVSTRYGKKNKKHLKWYSVQISGKKHVQKFLEMLDPEKMKEPYRRLYLGTRLILANSPKSIIISAKEEIQKWNLLNSQKYLMYSKKNAKFLRELCEKLFTKKKIKEINGIMYTGKLTNEMLERAIKNALQYSPNQFALKNDMKELSSFPIDVRNKICQYLFKILIKSTAQFTEYQLLELIKNEIKRIGFLEIYQATSHYNYSKALNKYFKSLIFLIQEIVKLSKRSISVIPKQIFDNMKVDSNWSQPLSYDVVNQIIKDLIDTFPNHLDIKQIESNKIINYLKNHPRSTKQEITKIYRKGLRATYNKLIELEKLGLVKRNRTKIGEPTYWSLVSKEILL